MKRLAILIVASALVSISTANAGMLTEGMLQKEYDNCMGEGAERQDAERAQYCGCVMNGMREWSLEDIGSIGLEVAKGNQKPQKLDALAQACIQKVLH